MTDPRTIAVPRSKAAELVGVSERELKRAIDDGQVEVHFRGRRPLVDYADLIAWYKALPTSPA